MAKALRTVGEVLLWVLGGLLTLLLITFVLLGQGAGSGIVRDILKIVNSQLEGRLALDHAVVFPNGTAVVLGAKLYGPRGELIAQVTELDAHVDLLRLAKKQLRISRVVVRGAKVNIQLDAQGDLDLVEAFQPRHPSPPNPTPSGQGGLRVALDDVRVSADEITLTAAGAAKPLAKLTDARLRSHVRVEANGAVHVDADVDEAKLEAQSISGPFAVHAQLGLSGTRLQTQAHLTLEDALIDASADLDLSTLSGLAHLDGLTVGPRLLGQLLPDQKPRGARVTAEAVLNHGVVQLAPLEVAPLEGAGRIRVTGDLDLKSGDGHATVAAESLDARAFLGVLPRSDVSLQVHAHGRHLLSAAPAIAGALDLERSRWDKQELGPGHVKLDLALPKVVLTEIRLKLPGGAIVDGNASLEHRALDGWLQFDVPDLAAIRAAATAVGGVDLPRFAGDLRGRVAAHGTLPDLSAEADLTAAHLSLNDLSAQQVKVTLRAPRVDLGARGPMDVHAQVALGRLAIAGEQLSGLELDADWTSPTLTLSAGGKGLGGTLGVQAALALRPGLQGADLSRLELTLPKETWHLAHPAQADFTNGIALRGLALQSGDQSLLAQVIADDRSLAISTDITLLELEKLPTQLVLPRRAALAGRLSGSARLRLAGRDRSGEARIALTALSMNQLHISDLHVSAALQNGIADVKAGGHVQGATLDAQARGPLPLEPGPLSAVVDLEGVELGHAIQGLASIAPQAAEQLNGLSGTVRLHVGVDGTYRAPRVEAVLSASSLTAPQLSGLPPMDVTAEARVSDQTTTVQLAVNAPGQGQLLGVDLSAPLGSTAIGPLLPRPKQLISAIRQSAVRGQVTSARLPLTSFAALVPALGDVSGQAQLSAKVHGTAGAPRAVISLALDDLSYRHRPFGDLSLNAEARDDGLRLDCALVPPGEKAGGHDYLDVKAQLDLPPEKLADARLRNAAYLAAQVQVSNLPLWLFLGRHSPLNGAAELAASLNGTLAAPDARLKLSLSNLQMGEQAAGSVQGSAQWSNGKLEAHLVAAQPAGELEAQARAPFAIGKPLGALSARLTATSFDLGILEPVLQRTDMIRAVGGTLDADLRLEKHGAALDPNGTLSLKNGDLALAGLGEFQAIGLRVKVAPDQVMLQQLSLRSADGTLTASADVHRTGRDFSSFSLKGHLQADRFALYVSDQLRARLSASVDLAGQRNGRGTEVTIAVPKAKVVLPDLIQRSLAPVALDSDIHTRARPGALAAIKPTATPPGPAPAPTVIHINAPGPIPIEGPDLENVNAKADLEIRIAADTRFSGKASLTSGRINAYNHVFRIDRGELLFGDGAGHPAPIDAAHIDAVATQEIAPYKVILQVSGRLTDPRPALRSEPGLPQGRIGQLLLTNGASEETRQGSTNQSAGSSVLGDALSEQIKGALGTHAPLDVVNVEPNRLEAGKYITPNLYVGVVDNLTATDPRVNGTEVHTRWQIGGGFAVDARYGTAQAGSADLDWLKSW